MASNAARMGDPKADGTLSSSADALQGDLGHPSIIYCSRNGIKSTCACVRASVYFSAKCITSKYRELVSYVQTNHSSLAITRLVLPNMGGNKNGDRCSFLYGGVACWGGRKSGQASR